MLWWFQRIARDASTHRDAVVVSEGPAGLQYQRCDESGASREVDATIVGALAGHAAAAFPWFTLGLAAFAVGSAALFYLVLWQAALAFSIAAAAGLVVLYNAQRRKKSVAIVYPPGSSIVQRRLATLDAMLQQLSASRASWILLNASAVFDPRLAAGMGVAVRRMPIRPWKGSPVPIESNLALWSLDGPTARLVFLPDQLLVIAGDRVAAFFYSELQASFSNAEFVETEFALPQDATVLSWRAVHNKKDGTPDRRFNQQQWPACSYSHLQLVAPNGVTLQIVASRADIAASWASLWAALQESTSGGLRGYVAAPQALPSPAVSAVHAVPYAPPEAPSYPVLGPLPPIAGVSVPMSGAPAMNALAGLPPPPAMPPAEATYAATGAPNASGGMIMTYTLHADETGLPEWSMDTLAPVALLRFLAVADRKFTDDEKDFIARNVSALCGHFPNDVARMLAYCPTSETDVQTCATRVLARGPAFVDALVVLLDQLPLVDGKATPNELTRLAQVRRWLGR